VAYLHLYLFLPHVQIRVHMSQGVVYYISSERTKVKDSRRKCPVCIIKLELLSCLEVFISLHCSCVTRLYKLLQTKSQSHHTIKAHNNGTTQPISTKDKKAILLNSISKSHIIQSIREKQNFVFDDPFHLFHTQRVDKSIQTPDIREMKKQSSGNRC